MASFTNQAQLQVGSTIIQSNVVTGEIVDAVGVTKSVTSDTYERDGILTYILAITNTEGAALNNISVSDNLGEYPFGTDQTLYPLTYVDGSVRMFINGQPVTAPTVTVGPPLVFSGINVPAGADVVIVYNATANAFAPLGDLGVITNCATVSGDGILTPITTCETVSADLASSLTITKSIEPVPVRDNGRLTYTFTIQNFGATEVVATDNATLSDTFDPILTDLTVVLNGTALTEGVDYTYSETDGVFATVPGVITVAGASYAQDPVSGVWTVTPGVTTLTAEGTV